ncbi:MAG: TauD/TfdA family dioxygenase [Burkholderiaceae bacterium]|nr:TauD/TfdA family dioxygenase [Burkholderiaceae bacterium]MBP7659870.1 TauD/TfdA family dioxygenase [Burkholderiaceae bacterium]
MSITICPVKPDFVAEVGDIDLSAPLCSADEQAVREAFARYAVLVFPAQALEVEQHLAFAGLFGPHERTVQVALKSEKLRVREEIADIANLDASGNIWASDNRLRLFQMGNRLWHTDSSFKQPTGYTSMLYARSVAPIGGHTQFADLRAAYDALPAERRARLKGLVAEHSLLFSRRRLGFTNFTDDERLAFTPLPRPLVRAIPESGRQSLYLASHVGRIRGMPDDEAMALIDELTAHATQPQFIHTHRWRVGDLVLWDNRCTMHRGTEFDDLRWRRDMQRATTSDKPDAFGPLSAESVAIQGALATS